jgi:hypothetical protein
MSARLIGQVNFNITPDPRQVGGDYDDITVNKLTSDDILVDTVSDRSAGIVSILPPPTGTTQPVKAATTVPLNLATDCEPGDVIDGFVLSEGDRILIKDQVNPLDNGIYIVQSAGTPVRSPDYAEDTNVSGLFTIIQGGATQSSTGFINTAPPDGGTVGTNPLVLVQSTLTPGGIYPVINATQVNTTNLSVTNTAIITTLNATTITTTDFQSTNNAIFNNIDVVNADIDNITVNGTVVLPNGSITNAMLALGSVTLLSAGGTQTLIVDGVGPDLTIKGLTPGTNISLVPGPNDITINATSPTTILVDDPASTTGAGTASIVSTNPPPPNTAYVRRIVEGAGIAITEVGQDVVVASTAVAVTLTSAAGVGLTTIVIDGLGPTLQVKATADTLGIEDRNTGSAIRFDNRHIRISDSTGALPPIINAASNTTSNATVVIGESAASTNSDNTIVIGSGATANTSTNSIILGLNSISNFNNTIAIGNNANSSATDAIAIGRTTTSSNTQSVAIGRASNAAGASSISLGFNSNTTGDFSIAIGDASSSPGLNSIAIGRQSVNSSTDCVSLGRAASSGGPSAIAIGRQASAAISESIAIGRQASTTGADSVAIGTAVLASTGSIGMGNGATANGITSVAIGSGSNVTANNVVCIGTNTSSASGNAIAIGNNAAVSSTNGIAIGLNTDSAGNSIAIGDTAQATFSTTMAIGTDASANAVYSLAIGEYVQSSATRSITLGTNSSNNAANMINVENDSVYIASRNGANPNTLLYASIDLFSAMNAPLMRIISRYEDTGVDPYILSLEDMTGGYIVFTNNTTNNINMPTAASVWGTYFSNAAMNVWKTGDATTTSGTGGWFMIDNRSGSGITFNGGADWELLNHAAATVAAFAVNLTQDTHLFTWHRGAAAAANGLVSHAGRFGNAPL